MNQSLAYELDRVMPEARLTGLFNSLVTFFDRPGGAHPVPNAMGQIDMTNLLPVAGLQNIPCQLAPERPFNPDAHGGARLPENFQEMQNRHLLLNDFYPAILMRFIAVVTGPSGVPVTYQITPGSDEDDSQGQQTRLAVRRFSQ